MNITKEAIYHTASGKWAFQTTGLKLTIVLRTKKGEIKQVIVKSGDPFRHLLLGGEVTQNVGGFHTGWEILNVEKMELWCSDDLFDYWITTEVTNKYKRLRYAFEITSFRNEVIMYGESGFSNDLKLDISKFGFTWGYLNEGNIVKSPDWVSETVWYQIFPERFCNGDKKNDPQNIADWNKDEPTPFNYFGGDIKGIISKLDHLTELGVNGVYLTPIFKANTNHKYDTEDYSEIDPHFGDEETFKEFVKQCKKRKIRIMLDAVFNHSGYKFKYWVDVMKNKEKSKYKDWFFINDFRNIKSEYAKDEFLETYPYETFAYVPHMPRLNWQNKELRKYLLDSVSKWTEMGIDSWRLDVANEPSFDFWRDFRRTVRRINPDIYILGEVWYDSTPFLNRYMFDSVMNYTLRGTLLDLITRKSNSEHFVQNLTKCITQYSLSVQNGMFNLLGSHDTERILTSVKDDSDRMVFAYKMLLIFSGSPCIYYGDEIGINGAHDPGCRKTMVWDRKKWNMQIFNELKNFIQFRMKHSALRTGLTKCTNDGDILLIEKRNQEEKLSIYLNPSSKSVKINLDKNVNLINNTKLTKETVIKPNEIIVIRN